jgi:hypothetical protein
MAGIAQGGKRSVCEKSGLTGLGSILASVGIVTWSLRFGKLKRLATSAILLTIGLLACMGAAENVHIWALFWFIAVPALMLGLITFAMAFVVGVSPLN